MDHSLKASFVGARIVTFVCDSTAFTRSGYLLAIFNNVDRSGSDWTVSTRVWAAAAEARAKRESRVKCMVIYNSENEGVCTGIIIY